MTKTRGEKKERMPKKLKVNHSTSGSNGGRKCTLCSRRRRRSSKFCRRCSRRCRTDITRFFPHRSSLTYCPGCCSYFQPPRKWVRADPNSTKLLSLCTRLIQKPLPRFLHILNPQFVESPDHGIIKIKLHLRGEISQGAISERLHLTEFTVRHKTCESCGRSSSSDPQLWVMRVELRQRHPMRRYTLSQLEEAIWKEGAACRAVMIQENDLGTDFMFSDRSHALDLVQFVEGVIPIEKKSDDDGINATFFSLCILPIRQDDLIRLPTTISDSLLGGGGNLGPLVICTKVAANGISLMDPFTLQAAFLTAEDYWRTPFRAMLYSNFLVEYLVLDVIVITPDPRPSQDANDNSYGMAHVHITRVPDIEKKDGHKKLMVQTHLGPLLKPGDYVLGYDIGDAAGGSPVMEVILVKKIYGEQKKNNRERSKGKRSARELRSVDTGLDGIRDDEYEELLRGLEKNARLGLINASSPHQISKECQILPTSSDDVPSIPVGEWLGDEAVADNAIMDWLPSTQLSSPGRSSLELKRPGGDGVEDKMKTKLLT